MPFRGRHAHAGTILPIAPKTVLMYFYNFKRHKTDPKMVGISEEGEKLKSSFPTSAV
jgi:hypothetical protein